jgi:hypothetical protein
MKKLVCLGACLVALASQPVMAQTGGADVVIVKVRENYSYMELNIARTGSKPEKRVFKSKELKELGDGSEASGIAEATRRLLADLAQQGYSLTSTYGSSSEFSATTLVFTKRQ